MADMSNVLSRAWLDSVLGAHYHTSTIRGVGWTTFFIYKGKLNLLLAYNRDYFVDQFSGTTNVPQYDGLSLLHIRFDDGLLNNITVIADIHLKTECDLYTGVSPFSNADDFPYVNAVNAVHFGTHPILIEGRAHIPVVNGSHLGWSYDIEARKFDKIGGHLGWDGAKEEAVIIVEACSPWDTVTERFYSSPDGSAYSGAVSHAGSRLRVGDTHSFSVVPYGDKVLVGAPCHVNSSYYYRKWSSFTVLKPYDANNTFAFTKADSGSGNYLREPPRYNKFFCGNTVSQYVNVPAGLNGPDYGNPGVSSVRPDGYYEIVTQPPNNDVHLFTGRIDTSGAAPTITLDSEVVPGANPPLVVSPSKVLTKFMYISNAMYPTLPGGSYRHVRSHLFILPTYDRMVCLTQQEDERPNGYHNNWTRTNTLAIGSFPIPDESRMNAVDLPSGSYTSVSSTPITFELSQADDSTTVFDPTAYPVDEVTTEPSYGISPTVDVYTYEPAAATAVFPPLPTFEGYVDIGYSSGYIVSTNDVLANIPADAAEWTSGKQRLPVPKSLSIMQVRGHYDGSDVYVIVRGWLRGNSALNVLCQLADDHPIRLPAGAVIDEVQISVKTTVELESVSLADNMQELLQ